MRFRLTAKADEDLVAVLVESIDRFGVNQAGQYAKAMTDCFALLASQPRMGRERPEFTPPIRAHFHGSHVVAYVETDDGILILRISHAKQDWPSLM